MRRGLAGLLVGIVFGTAISWSGMTAPDVIRSGLLFQHAYLFLFFGSAFVVATSGLWLVARLRGTALLTDEKITLPRDPPERRHIVGALIFGLGWGVSDACPGPVATQLGQGIAWGLWTLLGVVIGVGLFLRQHRPETEPATDPAPMRVTSVGA